LSPNIASYLIGTGTFIGTFMGTFLLDNFGRRPVMLWGNVVMFILLVISGIMIVTKQGLASIIVLMCY